MHRRAGALRKRTQHRPAAGADADKMVSDAQKLNPNIKVIKSSLKEGTGLDEIIQAIDEAMNN